MARIEYKFSKDEIDLIGLGRIQHTFNENTDYIRLNVFSYQIMYKCHFYINIV